MDVLSQFLGYFHIIIGASILIQPQFWLAYAKQIRQTPHQVVPVAFLSFVIGLYVVLVHPQWSATPDVIITVLGWIMLVKGTALLAFTKQTLKLFPLKMFKPLIIRIEGVLIVALGAWMVCGL